MVSSKKKYKNIILKEDNKKSRIIKISFEKKLITFNIFKNVYQIKFKIQLKLKIQIKK